MTTSTATYQMKSCWRLWAGFCHRQHLPRQKNLPLAIRSLLICKSWSSAADGGLTSGSCRGGMPDIFTVLRLQIETLQMQTLREIVKMLTRTTVRMKKTGTRASLSSTTRYPKSFPSVTILSG
ncbi:unnamed protein product [Amoebophrya sp. A120]|nr:unnamed protein product [Amoebophrya sp. A120]|eukprot:GSA120T00024993001.1